MMLMCIECNDDSIEAIVVSRNDYKKGCSQLGGIFRHFGMHCTCALREYEVVFLFEGWEH